MEFFIKKNTTLPLLKMQVINDGRFEFNTFMELLETATITFSMKNEKNGVIKLSNKRAFITNKTNLNPNAPNEYYIYYRFSNKDTNKEGRYVGQFLINTKIGTLICPLREELFINVDETIKY